LARLAVKIDWHFGWFILTVMGNPAFALVSPKIRIKTGA